MQGSSNQIRTPKLKPWMVAVFAIVVILLLGIAIGGGMYNSMNASRQVVDSDWAQVENVMQRRADLIPNLVASVKGEMRNEQEIFKSIAASRKAFETSDTQAGKLAADDELNAQTTVLLNAVKENYPDLTSSEQVKTLMTQLEGSENRISVERGRYIDDVADYNRKPLRRGSLMTRHLSWTQRYFGVLIVTVNNIGGSVSWYLMRYGRGLYVCRQLIDNVIAESVGFIHQCAIFD